MFFAKHVDNDIFIAFQDTSFESKDLYRNIQKSLPKLSKRTLEKIKEFLANNDAIDQNARRQKNYISHLKTYIDIVDDKTPLVLSIYVIPKDLDITFEDSEEKIQSNIDNFQKLSFDIFRLYSEIVESKNKEFETFDASKGKDFIDFEFEFYFKKLSVLHDFLLNYKRTLKDKIIVSDKKIGVEVDELNALEADKLKIYQFVKVPYQSDLIVFIFSLIEYLKERRLLVFKGHSEYKKLQVTINKIDNFLRKISTSKHIKKENLTQAKLVHFFAKYQNSKEIQKNKIIFGILEEIFYNQLKNNAFIFQTIDMTKMFEKVVHTRLQQNYVEEAINIGNETTKTFIGKDREILNERRYLLADKKLPQYPDFAISGGEVFHIVDAKYKTMDKLWLDSNAFRQVIVYAKLFNKDTNLQNVNKSILCAKSTRIDLDTYERLCLNTQFSDTSNEYIENVFDEKILIEDVQIFLDA